MSTIQKEIPVIGLNTRQAAKSLGMCERTLRKSDAPRVMVGNKLFWNPEQLREWMKENSTTGKN